MVTTSRYPSSMATADDVDEVCVAAGLGRVGRETRWVDAHVRVQCRDEAVVFVNYDRVRTATVFMDAPGSSTLLRNAIEAARSAL